MDVIIKTEGIDFLYQNLSSLTRFKSSEISIENISEIKDVEVAKVEISAIVVSIRLDNRESIIRKNLHFKRNYNIIIMLINNPI